MCSQDDGQRQRQARGGGRRTHLRIARFEFQHSVARLAGGLQASLLVLGNGEVIPNSHSDPHAPRTVRTLPERTSLSARPLPTPVTGELGRGLLVSCRFPQGEKGVGVEFLRSGEVLLVLQVGAGEVTPSLYRL